MSRKKPRMTKTIIALWVFIILVAAFWIYAIITYGGKPITEIPIWAVWLLFGK